MKKVFKPRVMLPSIIIIFFTMQVFRIDRANPPINQETDFVNMMQPPADIATLIKTGCYDCHSNETVYPWYSQIAPLSWSIKNHITEGRENLNFSEWGNYMPGKRGHKLDECREKLVGGEMPLPSYKLLHSSARFSEEEKALLVAWFTID